MRIAVDAMGSDSGPEVVVRGAISAAQAAGDELSVTLVGEEGAIWQALTDSRARDLPIFVSHARQQVEMGEKAQRAFRRKRDSSIAVCAALVREGAADALVSAGNTAAVVTTALLSLGRMRGIARPAIASVIPTSRGRCVILDVGANADCKPIHLYQFAQLGRIYAERALGISAPRVGLLNIGEEPTKGNAVTQAAYRLLDADREALGFIGNVEGRDIFAGRADVVVCDGFTGNVILKLAESLASVARRVFREEVRRSPFYSLGALLVRPAFTGVASRLNYEEHGGALLLGTRGVSVIGHGQSSSRAIRNAILVAARSVRGGLEAAVLEAMGAGEAAAATGG
ncbi:MAG: phosphate acyltransferase PlsX [Candidatus Eisenbacteria bacterium]|nr:phosphate acyltransferase PlsX [Candidatus Eisenbacteria bacterium]